MRLTLAFILSIIFAVGLVAFGFTFYQISAERNKLTSELEIRTARIAEEIFQDKNIFFGESGPKKVERLTDSISRRYNLAGIADLLQFR